MTETEVNYKATMIFKKYLPLIYTVDEIWDEFQTYCKQFFYDKNKDYFVFERNPTAMNIWTVLLENMGGGIPLMVFAAGAFLILAYEKAGHNLDNELAVLPENWKVE